LTVAAAALRKPDALAMFDQTLTWTPLHAARRRQAPYRQSAEPA
jgi:hypothetical protein